MNLTTMHVREREQVEKLPNRGSTSIACKGRAAHKRQARCTATSTVREHMFSVTGGPPSGGQSAVSKQGRGSVLPGLPAFHKKLKKDFFFKKRIPSAGERRLNAMGL